MLLFSPLCPFFSQLTRIGRDGKVDDKVDGCDDEVKGENLTWFEVFTHQDLAFSEKFLKCDNRVE